MLVAVSLAVAALGGRASFGASGVDRVDAASARVRLIKAPGRGAFTDVAWLPSFHRLAVTYAAGANPAQGRFVVVIGLDGKGYRRLPLWRDAACPIQLTSMPRPRPDGTLAYLHACWGNAARVPNRITSLLAYDGRTGRNWRLVRYFLPQSGARYDISSLGDLVASEGDTFTGRLFRLGPDRQTPLSNGLRGTGLVSWSPDGHQMVADAREHPGVQGADGRDLYLLSRRGTVIRRLARGLDSVSRAGWSPDGRQLAVTMQPAGDRSGIWLIDVRSSRRRLILRGSDLEAPIWLPDGTTLVAPVGSLSRFPPLPGQRRPPNSPVGLYVIKLN